MKKLFIIIGLVSFTLSSCSEDEECLPCSAVITTAANGVVYSTSTMTTTDLCGAQLQSVLDEPTQVITITADDLTTTATSVYTCE